MNSSSFDSHASFRQCSLDSLEERIVFTAEPVADVLLRGEALAAPEAIQVQGAGGGTGSSWGNLQQLREQYGLNGKGQTVAVIDTGIAWDHYALGGGFGAGHKVVGGWDFAENDANPYDDGPAGYHGTHVGGIVGADSREFQGVAPGADLVALRVFNDQGQGNLDWVEQALRWVHTHKDSFANPITTVNLSLGGNWNGHTLPNWANLEDELAALKSDGIFVSVAAGNSFQQYLTKGLSYPAVSPSVIPVASSGSSGAMSDFSQRADHVLVAPGEEIRSTVPDHLFYGSKTGQFLASTGTSMAAPYVAGASVLLRDAWDLVGVSDVSVDQIYQHLSSTADRIYDQVTGGWYQHINLSRALSTILVDDHASEQAGPTNIGNLTPNGATVSGHITTRDDVDAFRFRATQSGTVTLTFETTHDLQARVNLSEASATWRGNQVTFQVLAGREYRFDVGTQASTGQYRFDIQLTPQTWAVDLGTVTQTQTIAQTVNGESLIRLVAGRTGQLTLTGTNAGGQVTYELLTAHGTSLGSAVANSSGHLRLDATVTAGQEYFVKLTGQGQTQFQATNLVGRVDGGWNVQGTVGQDEIVIDRSAGLRINVNGIEYRVGASSQTVTVDGRGGNDRLTVRLGDADDQVRLGPGQLEVGGTGGRIVANRVATVSVFGNGGSDSLTMQDATGNDQTQVWGSMVSQRGNSHANFAVGFERVVLHSSGGGDQLTVNGTAAAETWDYQSQWLSYRNDTSHVLATGFAQIDVTGGGGADVANVWDSAGNDQFQLGPRQLRATLQNAQLDFRDVMTLRAFSSQGSDRITLSDSSGNDRVWGQNHSLIISGDGFQNLAQGFARLHLVATGGHDLAQLGDSAGVDTVQMNHFETSIRNSRYEWTLQGLDRVNMVSHLGGADRVEILGTQGHDRIRDIGNSATVVTAGGPVLRAVGFAQNTIDGRGGADSLQIVSPTGHKRLTIGSEAIQLQAAHRQVSWRNTEEVAFDGRDQLGEIVFADFSEEDQLSGSGRVATAALAGMRIAATNFGLLEATTAQGRSSEYEIDIVDYLFMLDGQWQRR